MIDLDELIRIGRDTPAYHEDDDCLDCDRTAGEPCTVNCYQRGREAQDAVSALLAPMERGDFVFLRHQAEQRRGYDKDAPGFIWVWRAIEAEMEARGLIPTGF